MSRAVGRAVGKISLGGRRSCEDQVVTRREERDNNQDELPAIFQHSRRVFLKQGQARGGFLVVQ